MGGEIGGRYCVLATTVTVYTTTGKNTMQYVDFSKPQSHLLISKLK